MAFDFINDPLPEAIQSLDTILSLITFIVSLKILLQIRNLRKSFVSKQRLPEINKDLSAIAKDMARHYADWDENLQNAKVSLGMLKPLYGALIKMTNGQPKRNIKTLSKKAAKLDLKSDPKEKKEEYWDIYCDVRTCGLTIDQIIKDMKADTK